jgi:hypothetical protein
MIKSCFSAAFFGLVLSGSAFAAVHELRISGPVLVDEDPSCQAQSTEIANVFAAQTGAAIIEVACQRGVIDEPVAVIKYAAPAKANVFNPNSPIFDHLSIAYDTPEACAEGLATEVPMFTRHTGLNPFAAYCHMSFSPGAPKTFRTAIYAVNTVGQLPGRKFTAGTTIANTVVDPAAVKAAAFAMGQRAGLDMLWTGTGRGLYAPEITATWYGNDQMNLVSQEFGYVPAQMSCGETAAALNANWAAKGHLEVDFFCMDAFDNVREIGAFWWSRHALDDEDFSVTRFTTDHADIAACETARQSAVDGLQRAGETVLASLCSHAAYPHPKRPVPPLRVTVITK